MMAHRLGMRRFAVALVLLSGLVAAGLSYGRVYVAGVDKAGDVVVCSSPNVPQYRIDRAHIPPVKKVKITNTSGEKVVITTFDAGDGVMLVPGARHEVNNKKSITINASHFHIKVFRPGFLDAHLQTHRDVKSDLTITRGGGATRAKEPASFQLVNRTGRTIKVCTYKQNDTVRLIPYKHWFVEAGKSFAWGDALADFHVRVFHPMLLDKPMATLENVSRWSTLTVNPVFEWSSWEKLTTDGGCRPDLTAHSRSDGTDNTMHAILCVVRSDGTPQWTELRDQKWGAWKALPIGKVSSPVQLCRQTCRKVGTGASWAAVVTANRRGDDGHWRTEQADPPRSDSGLTAHIDSNGPTDETITHRPSVAGWYRNVLSAYRHEDGSVRARFLEMQKYDWGSALTFQGDATLVAHAWEQVGADTLGTPALAVTAGWVGNELDGNVPYRVDLFVLTREKELGHRNWTGPLSGTFGGSAAWQRPVKGALESPPSATAWYSPDQAKSPHSIFVVALRKDGVQMTFGTCADVKNALTWYPGWLALPSLPNADIVSAPVVFMGQ